MNERHYGLSEATQRKLMQTHLDKVTDRDVVVTRWWFVICLFICAGIWAFALAGIFEW